MNRRELLGFVGLGTAGVVSGCVGGEGEGNGVDDDNGTDSNTVETTDDTDMTDIEDAGVVTVTAAEDSVDAAFERITTAIEENENLGIVAELDHSANAESAGLELDPTRVVFFGNPEAGTPLLQESQQAGLDLPQRMLVRKEDGEVLIAYNDPEHIAARHGIEGQDELLENMAGGLEALATGET
ncbi:MAG: DUF302 domain-containing protein [Haloarculaceae archaeon]